MSKLHSAIQYLHSQVNWDEVEEFSVILKKEKVLWSDKGRGYAHNGLEDVKTNPIKRLMEYISSDMCVECLQIDYLYKIEFFVSLVRAYIEYLFSMYGLRVPISKEMAEAFIKHNVTHHAIEKDESGYYLSCNGYEEYRD